ncbi:MAG: hypothetical protein IKK70_06510 [Clostridia bacterium]|nr:hypothetical protein [Clostridia bacterium]
MKKLVISLLLFALLLCACTFDGSESASETSEGSDISSVADRDISNDEDSYTSNDEDSSVDLSDDLSQDEGDSSTGEESDSSTDSSADSSAGEVSDAVLPSYAFPEDWDYRFAQPVIGSFKDYNDDDPGAHDAEDGMMFGYDERLTLGCSSWCGCIEYVCDVRASSVLEDQGSTSYSASHLAIEDRENIWAEGVDGVGIGETIDIKQMYLGSGDAELTFYSICIVNGNAKNEAKWQENGRVKSLKLYYEDEYMGLITLEDTMKPQYIDVSALQMRVGNGSYASFRFEITEVYEGSRYEDTCLTGIVIDFEGIYAH